MGPYFSWFKHFAHNPNKKYHIKHDKFIIWPYLKVWKHILYYDTVVIWVKMRCFDEFFFFPTEWILNDQKQAIQWEQIICWLSRAYYHLCTCLTCEYDMYHLVRARKKTQDRITWHEISHCIISFLNSLFAIVFKVSNNILYDRTIVYISQLYRFIYRINSFAKY